MEPINFRANSRVQMGVFLIVAGLLIFARKVGAPLPDWLFTWPVALITIGLLMGIKHGFRNNTWVILFFIGAINLVNLSNPGLNLNSYIAPAVIVLIGIIFILRPSKSARRQQAELTEADKDEWKQQTQNHLYLKDGGEYIDSIAIFGGVKKMIVSKNFKGGEITCFMGGAEVNLAQADIQNLAVIEATQIFGGTKIVVPPHWTVKSEVIAIFGGIDDKRPMQAGIQNPEKTLVLRGVSIFGGIDLRSF